MNKCKTLIKAFGLSLRARGPVSMAIGLLGFVAAFLPTLLAEQLRRLTDSLQALSSGQESLGAAGNIFLGIALLYAIEAVFRSLEGYCADLDALRIQRMIKRTVLKTQCDVRYRFIENDEDFQKRIAFAEEYGGHRMAMSVQKTLSILHTAVACATVSIALYRIHPLIVVALLVTSLPAAILSYMQNDESFRYRAKWLDIGALAIFYYHMICGRKHLNAQQEIRHFGLLSYLKAKWRAISDEHLFEKNRILKKHVRYNAAADFLRSAVYLAVLLLTAYRIYQTPALGLGAFTLVYTLSGQMQRLTGECLVTLMVLMQDIPYMQEFFALEALEREPSGGGTPVAHGGIEFEHVSFAYPGSGRDALRDIHVTIREGEKIAVVGENGSGKSTFISLLCGMFDPREGEVRVGGQPVRENVQGVRRAISVVFQDFAHYEDTLRANITVSDQQRQASDEEIISLLQSMHAEDILDALPEGLDTQIGSFGERARDLSGGQWQKLSIARAAYRRDVRIMILDEPTSALDPIAEAQLYRSFSGLSGQGVTEGGESKDSGRNGSPLSNNATCILISHRLGITSVIDRILVFHEGRIVEDGSHAELMLQNGRYARMYRAQAQWYGLQNVGAKG